jgi:hypothetical protein
MRMVIARSSSASGTIGTFGSLSIDGRHFCATCEQEWQGNQPNVSCIPFGAYELVPYLSPAHGPTVVFHNPALSIYATPNLIPAGAFGRSLCEIHNANWPFQVKGCVAVGNVLTNIPPNGMGVTDSVHTFHELLLALGDRLGLTAEIVAAP